jgi:3-deoxy-manno-octulosonate cytidylyltransferase (CMP-KDO synthetase)
MILRTLARSRGANCFDRVICATDSPEIVSRVRSAGFEAELTPDFATGSDRVAFVASLLHLPLVVNLQGDEPVASHTMLEQVARTLALDPGSWVTASSPLESDSASNPHVVKVLVQDGFAQEFSRSPVTGSDWRVHRGVYGYSLESLQEFSKLPQSQAELANSLEQLRIMGCRPIRVINNSSPSFSVDVPGDIALVESFLLRST